VNACHGASAAAEYKDWKVAYPSVPRQKNNVDCGVFTCYFANYISANAALDFTQEDIPALRRRLTYDIIRKKISWASIHWFCSKLNLNSCKKAREIVSLTWAYIDHRPAWWKYTRRSLL